MASDPFVVPKAPAQASPQRFSSERRRALRQLKIFLQLGWILPLIAFFLAATYLYREAFADAKRAINHGSRVAQEQALKLFETNAMVLQRMLDMLGDDADQEVLARGEQIHARLKRMAADLSQVQGLFINGSDARVLATSLVYPPPRDIDYSDREFFAVHRAGLQPVFFTEQLRSRISGEPFFDMSRRRVLSDGTFAGSVHVSLKPGYLTDFYAELARSGPRLRFSVFRDDGKFLARWPEEVVPGSGVQSEVLRELPTHGDGWMQRGHSPVDGSERLRMFRKLAPYPLWIAASIGVADVRSEWLATVGWLALLALAVAGTLVWLARVALQRALREFAAAQQLDDETALRQRTEVALLQSQKLEALGRLTGGVAHDLNNLLMIISNNLFVHRSRHAESRDSPQLSAIERAIASGSKLTRQLLSFTRRQALVRQDVNLKRRFPEIVELLATVLGKGVQLDASADEGLVINTDPVELELALINLAVNAKDAMPRGGSLRLRAREASGIDMASTAGFVVIEVTDTGSGIAPELLSRVSEPFFTTKAVGRGAGLGLSQVQALCASAGGYMRIESEPGKGTRVLLFFPAVAGGERDQAEVSTHTPLRTLACNVLLVEDNDAVAKTSAAVLESAGCRVQRVEDAEEALLRLAEPNARFGVVLSDIEMPGTLDGIGLAERIAECHPGVPVVLMTGYASRLQQAEQLQLDVLPKPVEPKVLIDAIAKALETDSTNVPRAA